MRAYKSIHPICVLFGIFILLNHMAIAQSRITFKGRILDSETNTPLSFVTVEIRKSLTGVVTNEFGEFQYHIPPNFENGKVQISHIGYKKINVYVSEIKSGVITTFKMEPEIIQIQEVDINGIKGTPAVDIVNKAIKNIRKNYPKEKTLLYGYYRDYISPIWTNNYKNLTEAALIIEDLGFGTYDFYRTKVKLEQLRYNPDIEVNVTLNNAYDGKNKYIPTASIHASNELSILRAHDPIRNHKLHSFSFVDNFDLQFTSNHKFYYESITNVDSAKIFCINFEKDIKFSNPSSEYWVDGQIYIHSKSFAILKFTYIITCNIPSYTGKFFDLKLEYKNLNDKYYLNYLSLINYFELNSNPLSPDSSKSTKPFFQYRELFINKIIKEPFKSLDKEEVINRDSTLYINNVSSTKGFWESYNYTSNLKLLE